MFVKSCTPVFLMGCTPVYPIRCTPVYQISCTPVFLINYTPVYLISCTPVYLISCTPVYLIRCTPVVAYTIFVHLTPPVTWHHSAWELGFVYCCAFGCRCHPSPMTEGQVGGAPITVTDMSSSVDSPDCRQWAVIRLSGLWEGDRHTSNWPGLQVSQDRCNDTHLMLCHLYHFVLSQHCSNLSHATWTQGQC